MKDAKKTVIILGAGASADLGSDKNKKIPTGEGLVDLISDFRKFFLDEFLYKFLLFKLPLEVRNSEERANELLKSEMKLLQNLSPEEIKKKNENEWERISKAREELNEGKKIADHLTKFISHKILFGEKLSSDGDNNVVNLDRVIDEMREIERKILREENKSAVLNKVQLNEQLAKRSRHFFDGVEMDKFRSSLEDWMINFFKNQFWAFFDKLSSPESYGVEYLIHHTSVDTNNSEFKKFYKDLRIYGDLAAIIKFVQPVSIDDLLLNFKRGNTDFLLIKKDNRDSIYPYSYEALKSEDPNIDSEYLNRAYELISYHIIKSESKSQIRSHSWYRFLTRALSFTSNSKSYEQALKNLTIINFNYDRSLVGYFESDEFFKFRTALEKVIKNPYGTLVEQDESGIFFGRYGDREYPSYLLRNGADSYKVGESLIDQIKKSPSKIRTIDHDENPNESEEIKNDKEKIRKKIKKADRLYFLGFAFNDSNVKLLGLDEGDFSSRELEVYATNYGASKKVAKKFREIFGDDENKIISYRSVYEALRDDFDFLI